MRAAGFLLAATVCAAAQPIAISTGRITGKDLGDVEAWLGIPYAAPPVGKLRWAPPEAAKSWEGVRAMDQYGDICMQPKSRNMPEPTPMSEDCLTLNVWAAKDARKAPVMVWIHGGAFIEGSGAQAFYEGTELARKGVVVVTLNYRLGNFGFFASPGLKGETNFGLQDQIAALHWVRNNVAAFGGDPGNVTIFGESAGGESVDCLMISPPARGLFERAIAESGGADADPGTVRDLEKEGERLAREWHASDLAAMRALTAETIENTPGRGAGRAGPVVDGKFLPEPIPEGFASGKPAPVPFLLGANSFEASLMPFLGITLEKMLAGSGPVRDKIRQFYGEDPRQAAQGIFTDAVFLAPARYLAAQMEKANQPAFLYFFSYAAERLRDRYPGVPHGGEIPFVFDHFPALLKPFVTAADQVMADKVSSAWVQFAKTGNPNGAGLPEWPAYTATADRLLEWGTPIAVRQHFRAERLDLLTTVLRRRAK
ncbi:MAG TPA: carboxylesterase family protein [Bryobacteraceae bacterium]|nr:carboxylesterase family protein [Bryobacteraceae bacterium]